MIRLGRRRQPERPPALAGDEQAEEPEIDLRRIQSVIAGKARLGAGLDPDTQMGPLISNTQRERVSGFVDRARAQGARVLTGGGPLTDFSGYYYAPTVIAGAE